MSLNFVAAVKRYNAPTTIEAEEEQYQQGLKASLAHVDDELDRVLALSLKEEADRIAALNPQADSSGEDEDEVDSSEDGSSMDEVDSSEDDSSGEDEDEDEEDEKALQEGIALSWQHHADKRTSGGPAKKTQKDRAEPYKNDTSKGKMQDELARLRATVSDSEWHRNEEIRAKARIIMDNHTPSSIDAIDARLDEKGLTRMPTEGDGNCLMHAIEGAKEYQKTGQLLTPADFRAEPLQKKAKQFRKNVVTIALQKLKDLDWDDEEMIEGLQKQKKMEVWGCALFISAIPDAFKLPVVVYWMDNFGKVQEDCYGAEYPGEPLTIACVAVGGAKGAPNHYEYCVPLRR